MLVDLFAKSADAVGIVGVVLLLIAYYLLSVGRMSALSLQYQILNFLGAAFILYSLYFHWNTASALIEVAWIIISSIGIYKIMRGKSKQPHLYVINEKENPHQQNK